jgi:ribosomal protein S18 acetylase RimI-like enzyme
MHIVPTVPDDLHTIRRLFDQAVQYQEAHGQPVWNQYDKTALMADLRQKIQYKLCFDHEIAVVFSVFMSDPLTWGEREDNKAIYLHRIISNPVYKGQRILQHVMDWSMHFAIQQQRQYLRLDTWASNLQMQAYYQSFGFEYQGNAFIADLPEVPLPYRNYEVALFQISVDGDTNNFSGLTSSP